VKEEMDRACRTYGREEECIQIIGIIEYRVLIGKGEGRRP
jgi:hypothetical protein